MKREDTKDSSRSATDDGGKAGFPAACRLCPRRCGANRLTGVGACGVGAGLRVARAALHHWEEPCISGTKGSGTVFFSGCALRCCFCQNYPISAGAFGRDISVERLAEIFLELQGQGAHNINLVNPTHYAPPIAEALRLAKARGLTLPVVCNSGGYDSPAVLAALDGLVDIYLPDLKYRSQQASAAYSGAADYFAVASRAIPAMLAQVGPPVFDGDGLLRRGLIVRHLVLPGQAADSLALLDWLAGALPAGSFLLSLMCQYIPSHRAAEHRELNRRLTTLEYQKVLRRADELGLAGFRQERPSASEAYVPDFNLEGV